MKLFIPYLHRLIGERDDYVHIAHDYDQIVTRLRDENARLRAGLACVRARLLEVLHAIGRP